MKNEIKNYFKDLFKKLNEFITKYNLVEHKKKIIAAALVVCIAFGSGIYIHLKKEKNIAKSISESSEVKGEIKPDKSDNSDDLPDETDDESIMIDIDGAVSNPTMIELPAKSRLEDAITAAGGLLKNADTSKINRAEILRDGQKIYIPKLGEVNYENKSGSVTGKSGKKVNINTATDEELRTINGIGPSTAEKILTYRESKGPFKKIEDLKNVDGIGEKTYEKLKNYLTV